MHCLHLYLKETRMCFSATASFMAGAALTGVGTVTLKTARQRKELPFALIPLLFGIQQLIEGFLWLSFRFDFPLLNSITTYMFSVFSHTLWPIFVPFSVGLLETVQWRRKTIFGFQLVGLVIGLYLLYFIVKYPVEAIAGENIIYLSPHFYQVPAMLMYVSATCIVSFFSSHRLVKVFGGMALALFFIAYWFYTEALFSVWCFFSAILSCSIYLYFRSSSLQMPQNWLSKQD